ncbi:MAG: response regulator [Jaaginema sp. PMC 1079.18]|nr:response regulator [Jaaginema sp. PMC 1080.18]MEC4851875.1 response regulator [Jaaginema sp. PMC 1079.18]MEC4868264.1 response regulator [Jaaginema sp. PMC 1078.18]
MYSVQPQAVRGDILVVDDLIENGQLLLQILTEAGYEVRQAINGKQALRAVCYDPPDLILLDIRMPEMDGYQVCEILKSSEETAGIPVIFLSALNESFDKVKAFALGGADYIAKPFDGNEVLARVKHQLTIAHQQNQLAQQNQELKQLNSDLRHINTELEQFTSIVSHDLRQPLSSIKANVQGLMLKYWEEATPGIKERIERIDEISDRMNNLIENLLSYARLGSIEENDLQEVDCNRLLTQVEANLQQAIATSQACIEYQDLPTISANPVQLLALFQNLIANAIFYSGDRPPHITIAAESHKNEVKFSVRDRGVGIDRDDFESIFLAFKRLNPQQQKHPGTGIGLAICRKIVKAHGGKIWLESQVNVGTTFYFTLPNGI